MPFDDNPDDRIDELYEQRRRKDITADERIQIDKEIADLQGQISNHGRDQARFRGGR